MMAASLGVTLPLSGPGELRDFFFLEFFVFVSQPEKRLSLSDDHRSGNVNSPPNNDLRERRMA